MCFAPARAHQMESKTELLPAPFLPEISTSAPDGVISTAFRRLMFSEVRRMIFIMSPSALMFSSFDRREGHRRPLEILRTGQPALDASRDGVGIERGSPAPVAR